MHGQPPPTMQAKITHQASPHKDQLIPQSANGPRLNGSGKSSRAPSARNQLISKLMKEQKMTLGQASKHIKQNNIS